MERLLEDIRRAVSCEAWYAALALALVLPDICGFVDGALQGSGARYADWFDRHVSGRYGGAGGQQFLSGDDCYALRCAYLHQGDFDITDQRAQRALSRFRFVVPPATWTVHNNLIDDTLQLQVSNFCEDMCEAVDGWLPSISADPSKATRLAKLALIEIHEPGKPLSI